mmetsp:Transcript_37173/g.51588  ORF Transcript_37173/g.51588 Transcript_37173/m.51588 type:complete len:377 (-) Transcript_37173:232-1362(-)|eukprot:CAMPEP_0196576410 /NCGR_PEP_ID=MMETSP1081-20130531/5679_1 /TAXON_ID=36882 /ORGANISM="Pyramimonas amylifera, Strain CCMP720" /LENGTH=376 /DNA_ID=CAMNT_0041895005 /DNA_START=116 /DNA_END=1246 /DNA_ORIENTATION=-
MRLSFSIILCVIGVVSFEEEERLIGWKGETYQGSRVCNDIHERCVEWADSGECSVNPTFMSTSCALACDLCPPPARGAPLSSPLPPAVAVGSVSLPARGGGEVLLPRIGFGTAGLGCALTGNAVQDALSVGYRHLDTAQAAEWYCEEAVGRGLRRSGVPREEIFITTKQHPRHHGYKSTLDMFQKSLLKLGTSYIDLMLLHYPKCWGNLCQGSSDPGPEAWREAWRALEEEWGRGRVRALGVSNFSPVELEDLLEWAHVRPSVVQSHSDPLQSNQVLRELCAREGLVFTAYSSLGTQHAMRSGGRNPVLTHPVIIAMGDIYNRTPAQIVLRWALARNQVVIPRSRSRSHMIENLNLDFELSLHDLSKIDSLDGSRF